MDGIWLWIVLFLLVAAAILLFMFPLRLRVEFGYSKNAKKQRLNVFLNGFKIFKTDAVKSKDASERTKELTEQESHEKFMDKLRRYDALFTNLKEDVIHILKYLQNRCKIPKFVIHLDMGFDDAAQTGVASGAAYALVYGVSSLVYNHLDLKRKDMDIYVLPHFDKACLDFYFNGIFCLRLVHIIKAFVMLLGIYNKSKNIK